jgi:Family of unknown function (DUF6444)
MEPQSAPHNTVWSFPFTPQDWEHTPTAVQTYVHTLQDELTQLRARVEALEARLAQNSTTSHRPPSSDSPYKQSGLRSTAASQSGRETRPSGPSSGASAAYDRTRVEARTVCV